MLTPLKKSLLWDFLASFAFGGPSRCFVWLEEAFFEQSLCEFRSREPFFLTWAFPRGIWVRVLPLFFLPHVWKNGPRAVLSGGWRTVDAEALDRDGDVGFPASPLLPFPCDSLKKGLLGEDGFSFFQKGRRGGGGFFLLGSRPLASLIDPANEGVLASSCNPLNRNLERSLHTESSSLPFLGLWPQGVRRSFNASKGSLMALRALPQRESKRPAVSCGVL